jgi:phage gp46-like protein
MTYRIVEIDPAGEEPVMYWDTTLGTYPGDTHGDWQVSAANDLTAPGGLQSLAPIETAITLCLLTDARARPHDDLPPWVEDRRGWWGDEVDIEEGRGEAELGSRLWTLQWAKVSPETIQRAEDLAREALAPLLARGVCQRIDVRAEMSDANRIDIDIRAYGAVGNRPIARRYALIWERHNGLSAPLTR